MKAIHDFIVYTEAAFSESFKTEGGLELYADQRFSQDRLAQRKVKITSTPCFYNGDDVTGYDALIDPTIYYRQNYDHGKGFNNEIEGKPGYYKVPENMIVCIRKNESEPWRGFGKNLLVEPFLETSQEKKQGALIIEVSKSVENKSICKVFASNEELEFEGVFKGDDVYYDNQYAVPFFIDEKSLKWIRTSDVLALITK